jgi:phage terminase small subunit
MTTNLTPKQKCFVEQYLIDLNATQAAIRAGYSKKSARQVGVENLSKPAIAAAVAKAKQERSERTKIDADWVLKQAVELHRRAMQEIRPVLNPNTRKQVIDDDDNAVFSFNAAAAARSLEIVGKHISIAAFKDRVELSDGNGAIEALQRGCLDRVPSRWSQNKSGDFRKTKG